MIPRGTISLVFDDGYTEVFNYVVPLLEKYNMHGVFAVPIESSQLEEQTKMSLTPYQQWLKITQKGHEIAGHSISHKNLTTLSKEELDHECKLPAETLSASTLVYPGGARNEAVIKTAAQYYKAGRTVVKGFETIPPKDPMQLHSYDFTAKNYSTIKANMLALWAYATNNWLIETYHLIETPPLSITHSVSQEKFEAHLRFLSRLPVAVKTIQEVTSSL